MKKIVYILIMSLVLSFGIAFSAMAKNTSQYEESMNKFLRLVESNKYPKYTKYFIDMKKKIENNKLEMDNELFSYQDIISLVSNYNERSTSTWGAEKTVEITNLYFKYVVCMAKINNMSKLKLYILTETKEECKNINEEWQENLSEFSNANESLMLKKYKVKLTNAIVQQRYYIEMMYNDYLDPLAKNITKKILKKENDLKSGRLEPKNMNEARIIWPYKNMYMDSIPLDSNKNMYKVTGNIIKKSGRGYYMAKVETNNDIRYFKFQPNKKMSFNENDLINVIGEFTDIESYETVAGVERRMPIFKAKYVEIVTVDSLLKKFKNY